MTPKRASGLLLHITSLPSKYGIGDLGPQAYNFADFLGQCKTKVLADAAPESNYPEAKSLFAI